ncbi:diguanylate cyclase (GGDEF)-like protein/PAS domain S-box-containing protein [Hamadaea flava]|uniref:Bifunctional diguanylate cyclase/phosphodiesterase n=1 Tax=Hamadaea flava TaxID=1742688 RepID=A0ABV8LI09_9ACTN|nr:EAL domain-containing protein [Hamadaea flava]MCP2325274.1 diguanylate cyclase (GGDEF)-like protein/PAS domain S-box-containing protein [Hamadaea flava]
MRRLIIPAYAAWLLVLATAYFVMPPTNAAALVWLAIGLSSGAAVVVGIRLNRPSRPRPWYFLAGAVFAYAAADAVYYLVEGVTPLVDDYLADDLLYTVMFVLLMAGLLQFGRPAARGALLDALIVMCGVGLLTWIVLVQPSARVATSDDLAHLTSMIYPIADVVILAGVTRLIRALNVTTSIVLLVVGAAGLLVSDAFYRATHAGFALGDLVGLGWFVFYGCFGLAALVPSMRTLTEPPRLRVRDTTPLSIALLAVSALIPPAVLFFEAVTNPPARHGVIIAIACAAMGVLVLTRLAGVGRKLQSQISRERGLRQVTTSLVSAADPKAVGAALKDGVAELIPADLAHRAILLESSQASVSLQALRSEQILATTSLPEWLAQRVLPHPTTMAAPLVLPDRPAGDSQVGVLLIGAPDRVLRAIRASVQALTAQAALAMDRIQLGQELVRRNNEEYFRALVHNTADVILILDADDHVRYASPAATAMFGTSSVLKMPLLDLVDPSSKVQAAAELQAVCRTGDRAVRGSDWTVRGPNGPALQAEVAWRDLRADPAVQGIVVTLRDVTDRRRLERELTHRAYHDALTGLPNRALFAERLQQALAHADQNLTVVGVLILDLDDFKIVNDTLGHNLGDELLIGVSHRLSELLRHRDMAARLGGDEFAVIIEDAADLAAVEDVAARIVTAFREPLLVQGQLVNGSVSVGVATNSEAVDSAELLRHADLALYVAKGEGKGQWRRYQPDLHTAITERLTLRTELDAALAGDQLDVEYQPIVALSSGHTVGFEALVRWNHPTRGRLGPQAFIDLAEESGLIEPIGEWVLRHAIEAAQSWQGNGRANRPYVSVNVSAWQFRNSTFADKVLAELTDHGVAPGLLMLEITESLLVRDDDRLWRDLARLRQAGVRIAIDDFGTGYSSLSYLRAVPLDVLKIDRQFTSTIAASAKQRALVDGIVRLAHTLGLEVIAEGIETSAESTLLTVLGCPYGQGYLFAKPLPLPATYAWLARH